MRKLLIIAALLLSGCTRYVHHSYLHMMDDYRPLLQQGFRIYEESCPYDHDNLGKFKLLVTPEFTKEQNGYTMSNMTKDIAFLKLHETALRIGADGIMYFTYTSTIRTHIDAMKEYTEHVFQGNYILHK